MNADTDKLVYRGFWISLLLKGGISIAEIVAGIIALLLPPGTIGQSAIPATHMLFGNSQNFLSTHILETANALSSGTEIFVGIYLLSRGLVKVFLIVALFKNKLWAYPVSLVVLGLFVLYQLFQIITTHSIIVIGITLFDLVVMYFIWREWRIVQARSMHTPVPQAEV